MAIRSPLFILSLVPTYSKSLSLRGNGAGHPRVAVIAETRWQRIVSIVNSVARDEDGEKERVSPSD